MHIASDSWEPLPDNMEALDYGATTLKKYPEMIIEVRGRTDSTKRTKRSGGLKARRLKSSNTRLA